jgi:hypothetical protein
MDDSELLAYLHSRKRTELQDLAKQNKLKANAKSSVLIDQLYLIMMSKSESSDQADRRPLACTTNVQAKEPQKSSSAEYLTEVVDANRKKENILLNGQQEIRSHNSQSCNVDQENRIQEHFDHNHISSRYIPSGKHINECVMNSKLDRNESEAPNPPAIQSTELQLQKPTEGDLRNDETELVAGLMQLMFDDKPQDLSTAAVQPDPEMRAPPAATSATSRQSTPGRARAPVLPQSPSPSPEKLLTDAQLRNIQAVVNIDPEMDRAREDALRTAEADKARAREQRLRNWAVTDLFAAPASTLTPFLAGLAGCPAVRSAYRRAAAGGDGAEAGAALRGAVARILELEAQAGRWYGAETARPFFEEAADLLAAALDGPADEAGIDDDDGGGGEAAAAVAAEAVLREVQEVRGARGLSSVCGCARAGVCACVVCTRDRVHVRAWCVRACVRACVRVWCACVCVRARVCVRMCVRSYERACVVRRDVCRR